MHKNNIVKLDDIVEEVPTMLLCQIDLTDSCHWQEAILRMIHRKNVESTVLETSAEHGRPCTQFKNQRHQLWFTSLIGWLLKACAQVLSWSRPMQFGLLLKLAMFFTTT